MSLDSNLSYNGPNKNRWKWVDDNPSNNPCFVSQDGKVFMKAYDLEHYDDAQAEVAALRLGAEKDYMPKLFGKEPLVKTGEEVLVFFNYIPDGETGFQEAVKIVVDVHQNFAEGNLKQGIRRGRRNNFYRNFQRDLFGARYSSKNQKYDSEEMAKAAVSLAESVEDLNQFDLIALDYLMREINLIDESEGREKTFINGDLKSGHFRDGKLVDWGLSRLGYPEIDVGGLLYAFPEVDANTVFDAYCDLTKPTDAEIKIIQERSALYMAISAIGTMARSSGDIILTPINYQEMQEKLQENKRITSRIKELLKV